jgi:hypothetical protein
MFRMVGSGSAVHFSEMSWPTLAKARQLDHLLRYGEPTRSDLLSAASICSAYSALVEKNMGNRNEVVRVLRAADAVPPPEDQPEGSK